MKLDGKAALVTGGTSGIGLAAARLFRDEGARLVVAGLNHDRLEQTRRDLGTGATVVQADLRKIEDIDSLVRATRDKCGSVDVLFASAGKGIAASLESVSEEQFDEQFSVNCKGVFFTIQKIAPLMAKGGSIVLTTCFLDAVGARGLSVLSASKAAVRSLTRSIAAELAPLGIRVNAISPGPISTPFHGKLGLSQAELDNAAARIEAKVPLHRFGEADEIAKAVLFLASSDSSYMTGAELVINGGTTYF
jgi:NAD(P)-dependent dehydrogenase (short-subunit alcohol dehydrogenase family)